MRSMKRIVAVVISVMLVFSVCCLTASALTVVDGDFVISISDNEEGTLIGYNGNQTNVQIPSYFSNIPVTKLSVDAFKNNSTVEKVVLTSVLKSIDNRAFMNCTSLQSVYIPSNVSSIGEEVFMNCTALKTARIDSQLAVLPAKTFSGCSDLTNVTISDTFHRFSYGCFNGCSSLSDLSFVENAAIIDSYAFNGTAAESVVLTDSIIGIPDYAFTNSPNLQTITIPESVMFIQPYAFDFGQVKIKCYYDSYAYYFATENELSYELIDGVKLGDADGDGSVNVSDVTRVQRYLAELETLEGIYLRAADANQDGTVDISDATALQMYIAEYDLPYPIGEVMTQ